MKLALIQSNPVVGGLEDNARVLLEQLQAATQLGADIAITSELALIGYPPRDLLERPAFIRAAAESTKRLVAATGATALIFGTVALAEDGWLLNQAVVAQYGKEVARATKLLLPSYDVFDERRYFRPGETLCRVTLGGKLVAVTICEDAWAAEPELAGVYPNNPLCPETLTGVDLIVNLSASPFISGKPRQRASLFSDIARKNAVVVAMVNQVGGNDELIFDGASAVWDARGTCIARAHTFATDLLVSSGLDAARVEPTPECEEERVYRALVLGTRDYLHKCGFSKAVLGLSGGIDSALVATIAADALGPSNVLGVGMPSRYSSEGSVADARALADNLGIQFELFSIEGVFAAFLETLGGTLDGLKAPFTGDTTWENIQARTRGAAVMAISNRTGALALTTGNKSEIAVGYCTLYGDMVGGLAVISDVPKVMVYRICRWLNRDGIRVPQNTIDKPPSAELRPDQKDEDSLPPYDVLDALLEKHVEGHQSIEELIRGGAEPEVAARVVHLVRLAEYKRRQAAPGLIISPKAFGVGRRLPVAQAYKS